VTERVIGGHTYGIQSMPARRQFRCLGRLRGIETALDVPEDVVDLLLETAVVDGKPLRPVIDELLRDKMDEMLQVVAFALEVNYADFFVAKRPAASPAAPPTPGPSVG
jgi:hypothetical protein